MPGAVEGPDWLSIREASRRCGVSSDTVRRAIRAGRLPNASRTSLGDRGWRVPVSDLSAAGFRLSDNRRTDLSLTETAPADRRLLAALRQDIETLRHENDALRSENAKLRDHTLALVDRLTQVLGGAQ